MSFVRLRIGRHHLAHNGLLLRSRNPDRWNHLPLQVRRVSMITFIPTSRLPYMQIHRSSQLQLLQSLDVTLIFIALTL